MSRRNVPKPEPKMNLSAPRIRQPRVESPTRSSRNSPTSPASSCLSSENETVRQSTIPEATSMMLVGCRNCHMYVMLAEKERRCPKCKTTVLLDIILDNNTTTATKNSDKIGSSQKK